MDHVLKEDLAIKGNSSNTSMYTLDATKYPEYEVAVVLWMVFGPCILLLGCFGNIATVLVMRKMKDTQHSSQYTILMALAVSDFILLIFVVPRSIVRNWIDIDVWNEHWLGCKVHRWVIYSSNTVSAWLVTLLTAQRTMAVLWPHRMRVMWTIRRTWFIIAILSVIICLLYIHMVVGIRIIRHRRCGVGEGPYGFFFNHVFTYVDLALSSALPSLCQLVCDVILSFKLFQATPASSSTAVNITSNVSGANSSDSRRKKASRTTGMILALSFAFFMLTLPTYSFYVFWYADEAGHLAKPPHVIAKYKLVQTVTLQLWMTNSSVNFLLYCLAGSKYRREFLNLLRCGAQSSSSSSSSVGEK